VVQNLRLGRDCLTVGVSKSLIPPSTERHSHTLIGGNVATNCESHTSCVYWHNSEVIKETENVETMNAQ
jgi:hypothetical protein